MSFLKRKPPEEPITGTSWERYFYDEGEVRFTVSYEAGAGSEADRATFVHGRRVVIPLPPGGVREDGQPDETLRPKLFAAEDALLEALIAARVKCRFVGAQSGAGLRELAFQVAEVATFERVFASWRAENPAWNAELRPYEGWSFFDEKLRPDEDDLGQIADRGVIEQLEKAGSNPNKPHDVEHVFVGPKDELEVLAAQLEAVGFRRASLQGDHLVMAKSTPLDLRTISATGERLRFLCKMLKLEYDGWGAAVVK